MIQTHISANTVELTEVQRQQILEEGFLTFGSCLSQEELIAMRFAYEQVFEGFTVPGAQHYGASDWERVAELQAFYNQPALVSAIGNPTIVAIAKAALQTDDIEYTGSILRRTLFSNAMHQSGVNTFPWHADLFITGDAAEAPDERVAIWFYLDDVTVADGATQMLPGSAQRHRENLRAGRHYYEGMEADYAEAEDPAKGVFVEAPAGGGMAFKSYALHRAVLNQSGVPRRIFTMDYRVRGSQHIADGNFQKMPEERRQELAGLLPESARYLVS